MTQVGPIFKREFLGYFRSPVAYVFLVSFLVISVALAFSRFGGFFQSDNASLEAYFIFYPWLFLFLIPAVGMRLWAEEKRAGTIELLFTLPVTPAAAVLGKFLAGWAFICLGILLSLPMAATVGYLGSPDWGVLASSYVGGMLMAGGYLGVCSLTSALTRNQVVSFVLSVVLCAILVFLGINGFKQVLENWFPVAVADIVSNFSFLTHHEAFLKGIIDPKDVAFFLSLAGFCLYLNVLVLER
ncbi:MAG: ABC transporter permease [Verrucomicrobia bacterium RIFCSPLOWO2_12_FULL_64_8]|nr:MAG: ABC transporter permease [Verrucomicrobia bacterium RIFCSPLOWO2_12_FULL_64_8]